MKKFFTILLSLLIVLSVPFSVPVVANAATTEPGFVVEATEIKKPVLHNATSAASILSQYIDLNELNEILLGAQQYSWKNNSPKVRCTLDASFKLPYSSQIFSALKTYVREESGIAGIEVYSASAKNSYFVEIVFDCVSKAEYDQILKEQKLLEIETNKLLAGIKGNNTLTDVEKALLIHDRLALSCSYGKPSDTNYSAHTAYSAIVLKKAVCQGYALAYKYLLELVGIKSEYVSSSYLNHGWNIVYINNVPYHVDVTWDDASGYTEDGKVYHDNFLRSTQGMIETGHVARDGSIDYNSTPTNTTYDQYFWQNSTTGFQLLNDEIYYFDNLNKKLMKLNKTDGSDATLVKNISYNWGGFSESESGISSFTKIASDGKYLYYSTPFNVYKLNPETNEETLKFTLDLSSEYDETEQVEYYLWGLSFENCIFTYDALILNYANWEIETESKKFSDGNHTQSAWITDKEANCGNEGSKHIECTVCKTVLKTESIPVNEKHIAGKWVVTKKSTTTAEGLKVKKCTICNAVIESASIPKIPATPAVTIKNTSKGIQVNWNAAESVENYIVYRSVYNATTKKWSKWASIKSGVTGTSYTDTTVKLGSSYKYTVRAVNGEVMSGYKGTSGLKYNVTPTVKVANASNGIKVSWSTAANVTGYIVYRSEYNTKTKKWSDWKNMGTAKADKTSWTDKSVKSGIQYKYTVRACNGKTIKSSYNKNGSATLFLAQPTVKIANNATGVKVSWSKVSGATGYTVYRSEYKNGAWTKWASRGTAKANKSSWVDTKVTSGVQYKYTVRAINGKYKSTFVSSSILLYLAQPNVKITNASGGIKVSWNASAGATEYIVYSSTFDAKTKKWSKWSNRGTTSETSWVDNSVKSGTSYKYTVRAVNGKTLSTYKGTSGLLYLAQPTVNVTNSNSGIVITWNKVAGATGYRIYRKANSETKWSTLATVKSTSYTDKNIIGDGKYTYTVRAYNDKVWSSYNITGIAIDLDFKKAVLDLVNKERAKEGLNALEYYDAGQVAGDTRVSEICVSFSHTRPDGTLCFTALQENGIEYLCAGENIAIGYRTPENVVTAWMNSEGHRANILAPEFTHLIVGYDKEYNAWVQLFLAF